MALNYLSIPNRSVFRYPGGKTWLVPVVRRWLSSVGCSRMIEPFCGGGIIGLTAVAESLTEQVVMIEKDPEVAAVWRAVLEDGQWLMDRIRGFRMSREEVAKVLGGKPSDRREKAFATLLRNRVSYGGVMCAHSGLIRNGDYGKGIGARWYPETLCRRIQDIQSYKDRIVFIKGDAFRYFDGRYGYRQGCCFIDPPYSVAGRKLYRYGEVDNELLFKKVSSLPYPFLMTYDKSDFVVGLADKYGIQYRSVPMQTNHLVHKEELLLSDSFDWM